MWKNTDLTCLDELTGNSLWEAISKQIGEVKDGAVYVALREKGRKSIEKWYRDVSWEVAIIDIIDYFYRRSNHNDTIEICLTYDYENLEELPPDDARGVLGIKCYSDDPYKTMSLAPTTMIAQNSNFEWFQRTFQKQCKIGEEENVYMDSFKAHQFIILTGEKNYLAKTYRGCQVVSDDKVNYNDTKQFAFDMSEWIQRSISQNEGEEGKMLYLYWPSTYITDRSYNLLRVLTVPYILLKSSEYFQDQIFYQAATLCLRQQVGKYYNEAKNFGYVSGGRYADIGQAAFLGMSLLEHGGSEFEKVEENILKFTLAQYRENGSFETNFFPTNKKDDYLFYPGETLIYWSMRLKKFYDEELLEKALKAVEFYKNWFESQEEKKPYFVSWQSVAISNLYDITKEKWLYEYAAELNDWLLEFQQIDDAPYEDLSGRFYDESGKEDLSTVCLTGVFLYGTANVMRNAVEIGDLERANKYRKHVLAGIRSLMQNAISDKIDCFHMLRIRRAIGALKMKEYNNMVRCDTTEHALRCILTILENFDEKFFDKDFSFS